MQPVLEGSPAWRKISPRPVWAIASAFRNFPPQDFTALDGALRHLNFDPATLLPGVLDLFRHGGRQWGMPVSLVPYALYCQRAAFAGAGLPLPSPRWTLDDFITACNAIRRAVRQDALPGFYGPLPPLLGTSTYTLKTYRNGRVVPVTTTFYGDLIDGVLTASFAAGFGGWLVRDGRFDFTNPGALAGLQRLLEIAVEFGASPRHLPHGPGQQAVYRRGAAMYVSQFRPEGGGGGVLFVRLPRLPAAPVVPADLSGVELAYYGAGGGPFDGGASHDPPDAAVAAPVAFARWQYRRVRANPLADLPAPVVADPATQSRYWSAPLQVADGASAVADGKNFLFLGQGWPPGLSPNLALFGALSAAAAGQDLKSALAAAEKQMNARAAQAGA